MPGCSERFEESETATARNRNRSAPVTPNDRRATASRSLALQRYGKSGAFDGRSPRSPDMRISAINRMPTNPPPTIPATTHQNETIWSPPFHWSRNTPASPGSARGPTSEQGAFGCPSGAQQSLHSFESFLGGGVLRIYEYGRELKKRPGTNRVVCHLSA